MPAQWVVLELLLSKLTLQWDGASQGAQQTSWVHFAVFPGPFWLCGTPPAPVLLSGLHPSLKAVWGTCSSRNSILLPVLGSSVSWSLFQHPCPVGHSHTLLTQHSPSSIPQGWARIAPTLCSPSKGSHLALTLRGKEGPASLSQSFTVCVEPDANVWLHFSL